MLRFCILLAAGILLLGAEDPWTKVKDLKTGQEVRVIKKSTAQPIMGTFDELTDESVVVVVKKQQTAIARDEIVRIDARPRGGSRVKRESHSETKDPEPPRGLPTDARAPQTNTTSGISIGDKPDFETVYRRTSSSAGQQR